MLRIHCYKCGNELAAPGAVIVAPPSKDSPTGGLHNICRDCWIMLFKWLCGIKD